MRHKLSAVKVKQENNPGLYSDGEGLYLKVTKTGTRSWIFRWRDKKTKKLRDMGLGKLSLADARGAADDARAIVRAGGDPILERKSERAQSDTQELLSGGITFSKAATQYIDSKVKPESKNEKHVQQWRNTIRDYANPLIGNLPVDEITRDHVLAILKPIWSTKTETATRLRQRMERVLGWATVMGYRSGENPARWENYLDNVLPSPGKVQVVKHFDAMPYTDLPEFVANLQARPATSARALEFLILSACRTGDVRGALWSEIDLKTKTWTIPAERMKMKRSHTVPLTKRMIQILKNQQGEHEEYVFPNERGTNILSNMAMTQLLKRMSSKDGVTVHGFRSSFKQWCQEKATKYPDEASELQLAHVNSDATRAAYARSELLDIRAKMLRDWEQYVNSSSSPKK